MNFCCSHQFRLRKTLEREREREARERERNQWWCWGGEAQWWGHGLCHLSYLLATIFVAYWRFVLLSLSLSLSPIWIKRRKEKEKNEGSVRRLWLLVCLNANEADPIEEANEIGDLNRSGIRLPKSRVHSKLISGFSTTNLSWKEKFYVQWFN